jgi:hypothetical protein
MLRRIVWYKLTNVSGELSAAIIALMTEVTSTSETSVNHHTSRRNIPEDSHLHKSGVFPAVA